MIQCARDSAPQMKCIGVLCLVVVTACARGTRTNSNEECAVDCVGADVFCAGGQCHCARADTARPDCVRCPGLGERCSGVCCSRRGGGGRSGGGGSGGGGGGGGGNATLQCWQGSCQRCFDEIGAWVCRDTYDNPFAVSVFQVVMSCCLVLGVLFCFLLISRLCAAPQISGDSLAPRLSVGSLQVYVDERLRDRPPRYSGAAPPPSPPPPAPTLFFVNAGFVHDSSVPPPVYTPRVVKENDASAPSAPPALTRTN